MKLFGKRAPRIGRKSYLVNYDVYNLRRSLVSPVCRGHYALSSDGPLDIAPDIGALSMHVITEVKNTLDTELIGSYYELSPEALKPDNFAVVITSITPVF